MSRIFLIVTLAIGFHYAVQAQTGVVSGTITYQNKPVEGVQIQILKSGRGTVSDKSGVYKLTNTPIGKQKIRVSMIGFKPIEKEIEIADGTILTESFALEEDILNLNQVVVTGTRSEIQQYNSTVIVSTISNRTFDATQSLTLSEGLSFTPGLRLENNCQNCGFTQLRMNGLDGPYSQILINSRPIFSALAGVYGLDMLPVSMIDRVEVVRGGGSVLYGGNAIAGTVNIITKDPIQNSFEAGLNQSFTDFTTPDRTLTFNGAIVSDDLEKGVSFYGYTRSREPWDANDDGFSEITKLRNNTFGFDAFWNFSSRNKLKAGFYNISEFRRGGNAFHLAPHQSDLTEQLDHKITGANFSFEQYSKNFNHKISIYGSSQFVDRDSYYGGGGRVLTENDTLTQGDILAINAYGKSKDISVVGGLQYVYDISEKAMLTTGMEFQYNEVKDEMPGYGRKIDQRVETTGTYAQLQLKPVAKLTLLLGGRFDNVNIDGLYYLEDDVFRDSKNLKILVPRISAMYEITKNLKTRVSFAQGYRAPQAFDEDLHIETVGGAVRFIRLSPDLITERSNSFTASLNYGRTFGKTQLSIVAEGFYTQLTNPFILSDQNELPSGISIITKRNGDGASVQGVNLEANFAFSKKLILQTGATLQSALYNGTEEIWAPEDEDDPTPPAVTNRILRTPNAYGYFTLVYNPLERISISYSGVLTGNMKVAHVIDPVTEQTVIKDTPSFFENNIKITYTIKLKDKYRVQFFGGVQNIFNSYQSDFDSGAARDAGYTYGPNRPRTAFTGLKFGFN